MPDRLATLPLAAIDPPPWGNPKIKITGVYREGLAASLDHFGFRDTLKVWPDPRHPGRYINLDGNQRLELLKESGVETVECRILDDLSPDDAKLFNATFNRNHSRHDEARLADIAESLKGASANLVKTLLRPQAVLVRPQTAEPDAEPDEPAPSDPDAPWGAPPADGPEPPAPTIPVMFALSREGHAVLAAGLLRARARVVRARRLTEALALADDESIDDDDIAETFLRVYQGRRGVARVTMQATHDDG